MKKYIFIPIFLIILFYSGSSFSLTEPLEKRLEDLSHSLHTMANLGATQEDKKNMVNKVEEIIHELRKVSSSQNEKSASFLEEHVLKPLKFSLEVSGKCDERSNTFLRILPRVDGTCPQPEISEVSQNIQNNIHEITKPEMMKMLQEEVSQEIQEIAAKVYLEFYVQYMGSLSQDPKAAIHTILFPHELTPTEEEEKIVSLTNRLFSNKKLMYELEKIVQNQPVQLKREENKKRLYEFTRKKFVELKDVSEKINDRVLRNKPLDRIRNFPESTIWATDAEGNRVVDNFRIVEIVRNAKKDPETTKAKLQTLFEYIFPSQGVEVTERFLDTLDSRLKDNDTILKNPAKIRALFQDVLSSTSMNENAFQEEQRLKDKKTAIQEALEKESPLARMSSLSGYLEEGSLEISDEMLGAGISELKDHIQKSLLDTIQFSKEKDSEKALLRAMRHSPEVVAKALLKQKDSSAFLSLYCELSQKLEEEKLEEEKIDQLFTYVGFGTLAIGIAVSGGTLLWGTTPAILRAGYFTAGMGLGAGLAEAAYKAKQWRETTSLAEAALNIHYATGLDQETALKLSKEARSQMIQAGIAVLGTAGDLVEFVSLGRKLTDFSSGMLRAPPFSGKTEAFPRGAAPWTIVDGKEVPQDWVPLTGNFYYHKGQYPNFPFTLDTTSPLKANSPVIRLRHTRMVSSPKGLLQRHLSKKENELTFLDRGGFSTVFVTHPPKPSDLADVQSWLARNVEQVVKVRKEIDPQILKRDILVGELAEDITSRVRYQGKSFVRVEKYQSDLAEMEKGIFRQNFVQGPMVSDLEFMLQRIEKNDCDRFCQEALHRIGLRSPAERSEMKRKIAALETMYEKTRQAVVRRVRSEVRLDFTNRSFDGETSLVIGMDYNGGRNVIYDVEKQEFVIIDW